MLTKRQFFLVVLLVLAVVLPAGTAQARGLNSSETSLLNTMNAVRKSRGLTPLRHAGTRPT